MNAVQRRRRPLLRWIIAVIAVIGVIVFVAIRGRPRGPRAPGADLAGHRPSGWVLPPRLTPTPASDPAGTAAAPRGNGLSVRVEDVTGGPVPGALVRTGGEEGRQVGRTDNQGRLRLAGIGLPPLVRVSAEADGYATSSTVAQVPGEVVVRLLPESLVSGRVVERGTGKPVPGLAVTCYGRQTTSRSDGGFTLAGVSPGHHRIAARGEGWSGVLAESFEIGPAGHVRDLVVEVNHAFAVSGRVLAQGHGVAGRQIDVTSPGGDRFSTTSGDGGQYRIVALPSGDYRLEVSGAGSMPTFVERLLPVVDRDVTLDIELGRRHRVDFEVVDGSGRPMAGIAVHVTQEHDRVRASPFCQTDAAGRCSVLDLRPGPFVYKTDSGDERGTVSPTGGPVRIVMQGLGNLHGRLARADGRPVGGRFIIASRRGAAGSATAHSDDAGEFRMSQLPPGLYDVQVYLRNLISGKTPPEANARIQVEPDRTAEIQLSVASATSVIAGIVVDEAGTRIADALVTYDYFDGSSDRGPFRRGLDLCASDDQGAFHFSDVLGHYPYSVTAVTRDGRVARIDDVAPGTKAAVLRLEGVSDLTVEVTGFGSKEVTVLVRRNGQLELFRSGGGNGATYHFDNLRPGPVMVSVTDGTARVEAAVTLAAGRPATVRLGRSPPIVQ